RLYVASDGGGSANGGLWVSPDAGAHFTSLAPPLPEVTAVAVTGDDPPGLVVATVRPADHTVSGGAYRDAGGKPQGPGAPPPAAPCRAAPDSSAGSSGPSSRTWDWAWRPWPWWCWRRSHTCGAAARSDTAGRSRGGGGGVDIPDGVWIDSPAGVVETSPGVCW